MSKVKQKFTKTPRYSQFARKEGITAETLHPGDMVTRKETLGMPDRSHTKAILSIEAVHGNTIYAREEVPGHYCTSLCPADLPLPTGKRTIQFSLLRDSFVRVTKAHFDKHTEFMRAERRRVIDESNRFTLKYKHDTPWIPGGNEADPRNQPKAFTSVPLSHVEGNFDCPADKYHDVIVALVQRGRIHAIRILREAIGSSLRAAKDMVEIIDKGMGNISKAKSEATAAFVIKLAQATKKGIISQQQYIDIAQSVID